VAYISFQPSDHFNSVLYTGNGSTQSVTGIGFQPDWVWIKRRETVSHNIIDVVRGAQNVIFPDDTSAQGTLSNNLTAFGTDGFTLGDGSLVNANAGTYVAWNWKTQNSQGSSNTDGSINTTYTSVNTNTGISISSYTGTGSAATIGHSLGATPDFVMVKNLSDSGESWMVWTNAIAANKYLLLNTTGAEATDTTIWNNTLPTSSVFSIGTHDTVNKSGSNYVAYCFTNIKGFSKVNTYTGSGAKNFIYTGFKPAWLMVKKFSGTDAWVMVDNKRDVDNPVSNYLLANSSAAEASGLTYDFLSNGFAFNDTSQNISGDTYIYIAFAEHPLVSSNGVPATAR
jgi:hypothetical protein